MRIRIWIACLGGALFGSAGVLGVAGIFLPVQSGLAPELVAALPWIAAALPLVVAFGLALWLERGIVGPLRAMNHAIAAPDSAELRALVSREAWGEIGELADWVQALLTRLERSQHEVQELRGVRGRLESTMEDLLRSLEPWTVDEMGSLAAEVEPAAALRRLLERRVERETAEHARVQNRVLEVGGEVVADLQAAREAVEHAERGFVEATALLSALRELDRLGGELGAALTAASEAGEAATAGREHWERVRNAAVTAIETLVSASASSVERLAGGFRHVQEIADQVQVLGNRATLVALDAATRGSVSTASGEAESFQGLARDAQAATVRTTELAREVDREVHAAIEHMAGARELVANAFAQVSGPPEPPLPPPPHAEHLLERLRETLADTAARGERLAAASERASSVVERLVRRLDADARALEELAASLGERRSGS